MSNINQFKEEINRLTSYIINHPLYNHKRKNNSLQYIESAEHFLGLYFNLIGELFSGSRHINPLIEEVNLKLNQFNELNDKENQYNIPDFILNLSPKYIDRDDPKYFYIFIVGKQIGCINRAILLHPKIHRKRYCIKSLVLLKDTTIDLMDFIYNNSFDEIVNKGSSFFDQKIKIIRKEKKDNKLPPLVNGFWNFHFINNMIKEQNI